ncbi:MAG: TMEM175 family protein [Bdellovibrionota bacterium]
MSDEPASVIETSVTGTTAMRYQDLSRLHSLSDGVFAIVITLLIFDIKVPLPTNGDLFSEQQLAQALIALAPKFLSYMATFIVIGVYWTGYQAVLRHVLYYDRAFLWINIVFLMCVCIMPFPTSLLGSYWRLKVAVAAYGLSLIATGGSLALLWRYASHNHRLVPKSLDRKVIELGHQRILMAPLAGMLSILVSPVSVKLSLWIYVLAGAAYFFPSRIDRKLSE